MHELLREWEQMDEWSPLVQKWIVDADHTVHVNVNAHVNAKENAPFPHGQWRRLG